MAQSEDGTVWFPARREGLFKSQGSSPVQVVQESSFPFSRALNTAATSNGVVWAITEGGLVHYSSGQWQVEPGSKYDISWISWDSGIAFDSQDMLWVAANHRIEQCQGLPMGRWQLLVALGRG